MIVNIEPGLINTINTAGVNKTRGGNKDSEIHVLKPHHGSTGLILLMRI